MARLLRSPRNAIHICSAQSPSFSFLQRRSALTSSKLSDEILPRSPLDANIVRILGKDIDRRLEFDPPHEHAAKYKSFTVQDRYGEKCITMSRKFGDNEDIKIRATMFDGYARDPKDIGNKTLHISLFADISKGSDSETWQFACSVWPGRLEIQWVSPLRSNTELARPYFGGEMRHLKRNLKKGILEYLEARGIDGELSIFLHHFMKNKDRIEGIHWLTRVKSYVHK